MTPKQANERLMEDVKNLDNKQRRLALKGLTRGLTAISKKGWCRGEATKTDENGKVIAYCATGSIDKTLHGDFDSKLPAYIALHAGVRKMMPTTKPLSYINYVTGVVNLDPTINIVKWNDVKGRTKAQVVKAFREAIKLVTPRQQASR